AVTARIAVSFEGPRGPENAKSTGIATASRGRLILMRYLSCDTAKKISKIGLGTWQFGSKEWGYGQSYAGGEAEAIVRRALDLGVTLFDTAEVYGFGRS